MIKAIIFDCFGVLVGRGFSETYRLAGGDPVADAVFIESILGQSNRGLISDTDFHQSIADKLGISLDDFMEAVARAEQPNTELLEYIAELHKTYKTAILSNASRGTLERKLDRSVLKAHFDALIVSAEVGMVKPDAEIYVLAAERLGVEPSECVFTDDLSGYAAAARETGMQAITFTSFDQYKTDLQQILAK